MKTQTKLSVLILLLINLYIPAVIAQEMKSEQTEILPDSLNMSNGRAMASFFEEDYFAVHFPSPNVAEIMKYVDIPVNMNTGVPTIEIPLYTVECGDISLPVTLSYHAGGIKVDQVASWVGLGWTLNTGGAVSKTELDSRGEIKGAAAYSLKNKAEMKAFVASNQFGPNEPLTTQWSTRKSVPDLFSYSFMGYTGKFFAYDAGEKEVYGSKQLKFSNVYSSSQVNLTAIDLKGITYEFGVMESAVTYSQDIGVSTAYWNHVSAGTGKKSPDNPSYMLSKIAAPSGKDYITVSYRAEQESYKNMTTGTLNSKNGTTWGINRNEFMDAIATYVIADTYCSTQKPELIKAANGVCIKFVKGDPREDITNDPFNSDPETYPCVLREIVVYREGVKDIIKRWEFEYNYFDSFVSHPKDEYASCRLKLTRLKEYGSDTTKPKIYDFSYYGEATGEPQMPFRGDFGNRDFLGYCNSNSNKSVAAISKSFPIGDSRENSVLGNYFTDNGVKYSDGRNLNTNADYVHAYSLKSITYPTGGKRTFEYEPHTMYSNYLAGGLRIKKITNYYTDSETVVKEYSYPLIGYITAPVTMCWIQKRDSYADPGLAVDLVNESDTYLPLYKISNTLQGGLSSYLTGYTVNYNRVEEKCGDQRVVYEFLPPRGYDPEYSAYRFVVKITPDNHHLIYSRDYNMEDANLRYNYITRDYAQGHLTTKTTYAEDLTIIENYEYEYEDRDIIPMIQCSTGSKEWCRDGYKYIDLIVSDYITGKTYLTGKTTRWYEKGISGGPIRTFSETYTYNEYDLLKKTTTTNPLGEVETVSTLYSGDLKVAPYTNMIAKRMIAYPVEVVTKLDTGAEYASLMTYKDFNGSYFPDKLYTFDVAWQHQPFNGTTVAAAYQDPVYVIERRNSHGRITHACDGAYVNKVYLWGYNNMYPIVEIKNATYDQVLTKVASTTINSLAVRSTFYDVDIEGMSGLKDIPGAQVTFMTYFPLKGFESVIQPNGEVLWYSYDSHGRLKEIYKKDKSKKMVIESYNYNYKNK